MLTHLDGVMEVHWLQWAMQLLVGIVDAVGGDDSVARTQHKGGRSRQSGGSGQCCLHGGHSGQRRHSGQCGQRRHSSSKSSHSGGQQTSGGKLLDMIVGGILDEGVVTMRRRSCSQEGGSPWQLKTVAILGSIGACGPVATSSSNSTTMQAMQYAPLVLVRLRLRSRLCLQLQLRLGCGCIQRLLSHFAC